MLATQWFSRGAVLATAGACLCVAACGAPTSGTSTLPHTTTTNPIDLEQLDCPSYAVKAIITAIKVTIGGPSDLNATEIVCLARQSGRDVILEIKTVYQQPPNSPELLMVGPDAAGSLAQLQATLSSSGFTSVSGVGDNAASVIETVSGRRAVTLYVQRGGTEFHISMETALPDAMVQRDERTLALALLPQIRSVPVPGQASVNPNDMNAFFAGAYAASLLTVDQLSKDLGKPALPLSANGGRPSYAQGIDVSNAKTVSKDGSVYLALEVYRAASDAAARAFYTSFFSRGATPDPALSGVGDAAVLYPQVNTLYVLAGREIVNVMISGTGVAAADSLGVEKALVADVVPRLQH